MVHAVQHGDVDACGPPERLVLRQFPRAQKKASLIKTISYFLSNRVLTGSFDKSARIWDPITGECLATLLGHRGEVVACQFNAKGDLAATGSMDNTAKLFDVRTGNFSLFRLLRCWLAYKVEALLATR